MFCWSLCPCMYPIGFPPLCVFLYVGSFVPVRPLYPKGFGLLVWCGLFVCVYFACPCVSSSSLRVSATLLGPFIVHVLLYIPSASIICHGPSHTSPSCTLSIAGFVDKTDSSFPGVINTVTYHRWGILQRWNFWRPT